MAVNSRPILERLFSLAGKTALITGASGGIGQVLAVALAEAGAKVALHGTISDRVEMTRAKVETAGGQAVSFVADLTEVSACRQLISEAQAALGRLDILVNSAAINRRKPIAEITSEDYDAIMAVNLRAIYFLCQAAQPIMRAQGGGKIINVGSANSDYGLGTISVYGATKGGLAQVTRVMAIEWAKDNIQVNSLTPGFMLTPLTEQPLWGVEYRRNWLRERIPARRPGNPDELVGATLLLASEASSYMTGAILVVDGGFLAGGSWEPDQA